MKPVEIDTTGRQWDCFWCKAEFMVRPWWERLLSRPVRLGGIAYMVGDEDEGVTLHCEEHAREHGYLF